MLTSIRRYYSNTFTDRIKQDAMNLFLGMYQPQPIQCITALNEFHLEQKTYRELSTQQDNPKSKLKNEGKYFKSERERCIAYMESTCRLTFLFLLSSFKLVSLPSPRFPSILKHPTKSFSML